MKDEQRKSEENNGVRIWKNPGKCGGKVQELGSKPPKQHGTPPRMGLVL